MHKFAIIVSLFICKKYLKLLEHLEHLTLKLVKLVKQSILVEHLVDKLEFI